MNEHRFQELADAYGAEIGRWPEAERAAAAAFSAAEPIHAEALLATARRVDRLLDAHVTREAPAALRQRLIDIAPRARSAARAWRWMAGAGVGFGLAASAATGVVAGVMLAPASVTGLLSGQAARTADAGLYADPAGELVDG